MAIENRAQYHSLPKDSREDVGRDQNVVLIVFISDIFVNPRPDC